MHYSRAVQFMKWSRHGSCANQFKTRAFFDTPGYISSGLMQNSVSPTPYVPPSKKDYEILWFTSSTTIDQDEQSTSTSHQIRKFNLESLIRECFIGGPSRPNFNIKIGKGNLLLDLQKSQKNPIFRISVDIRHNTNYVRAFTTSANVPSIYILLLWNTLTHDAKTGVYSFQFDEHWLTLSADLLWKALNVTPTDSTHPF
ncbi:hypothetical protein Tco_1263666, partial [Tanacetum coccineum]